MEVGTKLKSYTPEFKAAAVKRYQDGETSVKIAADLGISASMVRAWRMKAEGVTASQAGSKENRKKYTLEFKRKAAARAKKEGVAAAAKALGINPTQVHNWMNGEGLGPQGGPRTTSRPKGKKLPGQKKSYYIPVAQLRGAVAKLNGNGEPPMNYPRVIKNCIHLLEGVAGDMDIHNKVDVTAALVLQTLKGL
jgi:transposase-like protein